jgi:aspartyl-tRNA(Asn)/glutamyl-tRNA(Gln) amidotransferase subunit A
MSRITIAQLIEQVHSGATTAVEQVEKSLAKISEHEDYHAVLQVAEHALERAEQVDEQIKQGFRGRLTGVPFVAKDNFLTFDTETTAASNILKGFRAPYQSTAVELLEKEGAIMVAKANLDAFGHGGSTENSDFGPSRNPHDKERAPGGSSGGPAVSVALGIAPFAIGTDTGGSNRQPASFSGTVGYKPTYGLVSRFGVVAMASSTDTIGPITTHIEDTGYILDILAQKDRFDGTMIDRDPQGYVFQRPASNVQPLRIGVIKEHFGDLLNDGVRQQVGKGIEVLRNQGAEVEEISLPSLDLALAAYYIIVPAEISSNLSRYDGIKFGYSHENASNIDKVYDLSRTLGFGGEAKRRIMIGSYVLSSGYYDAYYKKAIQVRTLIIRDFAEAFKKFDVLVGPTAPTTAFKLGEVTDPLQMYFADYMTIGPSLAGLPAISVPVGMSEGLPVGMHIIGAQKADNMVLRAARVVEENLQS